MDVADLSGLSERQRIKHRRRRRMADFAALFHKSRENPWPIDAMRLFGCMFDLPRSLEREHPVAVFRGQVRRYRVFVLHVIQIGIQPRAVLRQTHDRIAKFAPPEIAEHMIGGQIKGFQTQDIGISPDQIGLAEHVQPENIGLHHGCAELFVIDDHRGFMDFARVDHLDILGDMRNFAVMKQRDLVALGHKGQQAHLFKKTERATDPKRADTFKRGAYHQCDPVVRKGFHAIRGCHGPF